MVTRTETKLVTGKINGLDVTVPAGTTILEAARTVGVDIPNLCYQPLMRAWGSCRICTVEVLGKRGGLIESCATPLGEGMEVVTHSEPVTDARQFILQMYLVDHALDCPTCDKSGECYLQDNTYLHNVNTNPYRRPKLAQAYQHFSETIDYKWDRCIMCTRCTRVCDEMIGVTAIEGTTRSLEASIQAAYGIDLAESTCTNCGMCIAVCPVGALTDRHFGHHPWELDSTETICGFCDVGCTINVESSKGIVRRTTHLWERGVNHGYTCEKGRWGHELVQSMERVYYPQVRTERGGMPYEATWEDAIDTVAEKLAHYQGDVFGALASPDGTNEEAYALQQFTRAVMGTNNIDRHLTPNQIAAEGAVRATLGRDVSATNDMQELLSTVKSAMLVGPNLGETEPVASYWFYNARIYRETKIVVISQDKFPMTARGDLWLKPAPGTTATLLNGIARQIIDLGLADPNAAGLESWKASLAGFGLESVSAETGISADKIKQAAEIYATGGKGVGSGRPDEGYAPSLIYQTSVRQGGEAKTWAEYNGTTISNADGDPAEITLACNNLAILTGNLGRVGGGVATMRGSANYQGTTDMGAHPHFLPGGLSMADGAARAFFEEAWLSRWAEKAKTSNGFLPVRSLRTHVGLDMTSMIAAINAGQIKAMYIEDTIEGRHEPVNPALMEALSKLEFLVVATSYDSPLARAADVVLPVAMYLEKDGTFTSFDRTVQRLRSAVPAVGESKGGIEIISMLATRMGYAWDVRHASHVMTEISRLVPEYGGITYARLERGGLSVPVTTYLDEGTPTLSTDMLAAMLTPATAN